MTAGTRFWVMGVVLLAATTGLHLLSHGEAVSLAKPLASVPMVLGRWRAVDAPMEPRIVNADQCRVQGVVIGVLRSYHA